MPAVPAPVIFRNSRRDGVLTVVLALFPAVAASVYFFGLRPLLLIMVCVGICLLTEYWFQKIRKKPVTVHDGSAIITGLLLALTLPPDFTIFGAALGSFFAIGVGKQLFGGLGFNIFNPALLGRAFLMATYPVLMTTWVEPRSIQKAVDAVTAATPRSGGVEGALGGLDGRCPSLPMPLTRAAGPSWSVVRQRIR